MIKYLQTFLLALFFSVSVKAQWEKISSMDYFGGVEILTTCTDSSGYIYATERYYDKVTQIDRYTIAKFNGIKWVRLGSLNANSKIKSICTDAAGNVYAAGSFTNGANWNVGYPYVAKWNGTNWKQLGSTFNTDIYSLCVDKSGNIYAAGGFTNESTYNSGRQYVAKWDGSTWVEVGGKNALAANGTIHCINLDTAGNLYAGGFFKNAKGKQFVAKWNGASWSELQGSNSLNADNTIKSICADKVGNVYATGLFNSINGYRYVAKWNGTVWSELGMKDTLKTINGWIEKVCCDNVGNLYAVGWNTNIGANNVVKWDGISWTNLSGNIPIGSSGGITSISTDLKGNVYASGTGIRNINNSYYVSKWDGSSWQELGGTNALKPNNRISGICSDTSGNVYVTGAYTSNNFCFVGVWNGSSWKELTDNKFLFDGGLSSICTDKFGNIYAAGGTPNGNGHYYVAKWDGKTWTELGGFNGLSLNYPITSICADSFGNVYAAGQFTNGYSQSWGHNYVAKWNGSVWIELGGKDALSAKGNIESICSDASGNIYAAGEFKNASGFAYVAMWNGKKWSELGGINSLSPSSGISSICMDATGNLYAAEASTNIIGTKYISRWNGTNWTSLGVASIGDIKSICADAVGNIYAAGDFKNNYGNQYVAKWNGTNWSALGGNSFNSSNIIEFVHADAKGRVFASSNFSYDAWWAYIKSSDVKISSSKNTYCIGDTIKITATPKSPGTSPVYDFNVNRKSKQKSSSVFFTSVTLNNNDTISCEITSNDPTNTIQTATSNQIIVKFIPNPLASVILANGNTTFCSGGSVKLYGNKGGIWNTGDSLATVSIKKAGIYFVINSNPCGIDTSNSIKIIVDTIPFANPINIKGSTTFCQSDSVILSGNKNDKWNSGNTDSSIVVKTSGNYFVVDSNSCGIDTSNIINIIVNPSPKAKYTIKPDTIPKKWYVLNQCSGNSKLKYKWSWGDGSSDTTSYPSHIYSSPGNYNVCVTVNDSLGCIDTYCDSSTYISRNMANTMISIEVVKWLPDYLSVNDVSNKESELNVYPNPANNKLFVNLEVILPNLKLVIYDLLGKLVYESNIVNQHSEIDIHNLSNGIYYIKIGNEMRKFVKE